MKHLYKRLLALMLTGVLALSSLPATAWAEGDSLPEAPVAQTEICPDCGAAADIPGGGNSTYCGVYSIRGCPPAWGDPPGL